MNTHSSQKLSNLTFRVTDAERDLVNRAAIKQRMNVSDFLRSVLIPMAALDLGEPVPRSRPEKLRRRPEGPITLAAKARGISRDAYRQMAAELLARMDLEAASAPTTGPDIYPRPVSEMRLSAGGSRR